MSEASSLGHASPKTKSINVEANLLSARIAERTKVAEASRLRLILIGITLGLFALAAPALFEFQRSGASRLQAALKENDEVHKTLAALQKQVDETTPKLKESELLTMLKGQSDEFVAQTVQLLNSATEGVAVAGIKAEVAGGTLTFTCTAEAVRFEEAEAFAANAKASPRTKEVFLSSARQSTALGGRGMGFDLIKRVELE